MPSLYDVAKLAGVSKSTVSRVINNEAGVKAATREKVFKAIAESGYVVNQLAKDLKSNSTNLVGVIVPRITSHAIAAGVDGLSGVIEAAGMQVLLANSRLEYGKELEFIGLFNQKRVAGIIIFATHIDSDLISAIKTSRAPVVVVGQDASAHGIPSIVHDDYGVGVAAAQLLFDAGCRHYGFVSVNADDIAVDQQRYLGFANQSQQLLGSAPAFHSHGDFSVASGRQQAAELLKSQAQLDGIFCATDDLAIGVSQVLQENGVCPGKEVLLLSVGNDEKTELVSPPLTAFSYAFENAGHEAATMLLEFCKNREKAVSKLVLGFTLAPRATCRV